MTNEDFKKVVEDQLDYCKSLLVTKGKEYTPQNEEPCYAFAPDDRLKHFKKAGILMGISPKAALLGMLSKHLVSVSDMCMSGDYTEEKWTEKITDSINYMLLLKALVMEEYKDAL